MKDTVYIETSVLSYYVSQPSRDLVVAAHQQITREWWTRTLPKLEARVSELVVEEASRGDAEAARARLDAIKDVKILEFNNEVEALGNQYFQATSLPGSMRMDAYHVALATLNGVDFMVSWNCRHIVNAAVWRLVDGVNAAAGYATPYICTPEELMEV